MISPANVDFVTFANSLTTDFPRDIIPITTNESSWREWGNIVVSSTTFSQVGAPRTETFINWREWASRIYALLG